MGQQTTFVPQEFHAILFKKLVSGQLFATAKHAVPLGKRLIRRHLLSKTKTDAPFHECRIYLVPVKSFGTYLLQVAIIMDIQK